MFEILQWGKHTEVYDSIPTGSGLTVGKRFILPDHSKVVKFVKAAGSIADKAAVANSSSATEVVETSADDQIVAGANDNAGKAITTGQYFFITESGSMTVKVAASVNANSVLVSSTTAGTLIAKTANDYQMNIQSLAASGSGGPTSAFKFN